MKNSDLEKKSESREALLSSIASELFELREKNSSRFKLSWIGCLEDQIDAKEKLIKSLKIHINKMTVNKGLSDDSYSYPAVLFDQDTMNTVLEAESEVISKKQLKKEKQRQKKKLEALSRESSVTMEEIVPEGQISERKDEASPIMDTAPDSTSNLGEVKVEQECDRFLLESLAHVLRSIFIKT